MTRVCPRCEAHFESDVPRCPADGSPTFRLDDAEPMVGRRIDGRFTLTGRLGTGGMGTVYRALQHSIDREVALKLLRPEFLSDEDAVRRFFREARAASRLSNPHSITVFDFGQSTDGQFYIAMELLRGRSLSVLVQSEARPMEPVRAAGLIDQILEALEEAHREGVLHRDLKSDNVFVLDQPANFVKVLDFGLAKLASADDSLVTQAGTTFGTPAFMSPEQACGKELDARSDLYSVGAILFELLAGRLPFEDTSSIALILKKVREPAPAVAMVAPGVRLPPALDTLLAGLLSIDPVNRPASAAELRRLLKRAVGLEAALPSPARHDTVRDAVVPKAAIDPRTRREAHAVLTQGLGLAGEGFAFYEQATKHCTSRPARDLFASYAAQAGTVSGRIRRALGLVEAGESDWGPDPAGDRPDDPARRFEDSVRAHVAAIQGDAHLGRALDAALAHERRLVDLWERHLLAGGMGVDPMFLQRRLAEAKDHVASLAEVKLRVLGLLRGAGFNSLYMRLAGQVPVRRVRTGETLFGEGEAGDSMVVVVSGRFRLEIEGRVGQSTPLAEIGAGDVLGEMTCLDPAPRSATVIALSDSEVCVIDRGTLSALRETDPTTYVAVIRAVISQVADRVRETDLRIEALFREIRLQPLALPGGTWPQASPRAGTDGGLDPRQPTRACCFTATDLALLEKVARRRHVHHGAWVCREGDAGNACFVLTSGRLEIVKQLGQDELVLAQMTEGSVVGQIVLVDGGPRSASVRASGECEILELDRPTFERLVDAHVPVALRFQEQMAVTGIRQLRLADRWLTRLMQRRDDALAPPPRPPPATPARQPSPPRAPVRSAAPPGPSPLAPPPAPSSRPSRPPPAPLPRVATPRDDDDAARKVMTYMRTALREWGMSLDDLDQVTVVVPDGIMGAAEVRARRNR